MARERLPAYSRSGHSNLFGKLAERRINDFKLPTEVLERAEVLAREAGLPFHEYLREMVSIAVMGREEVERRFRARLDAMQGKTQE